MHKIRVSLRDAIYKDLPREFLVRDEEYALTIAWLERKGCEYTISRVPEESWDLKNWDLKNWGPWSWALVLYAAGLAIRLVVRG